MPTKSESEEPYISESVVVSSGIDQLSGKLGFRTANIEVALEATGFGKFNYFLIFISGTILTTLFIELLSISFILPISDCDLHLTTQEKGAICIVVFIGTIISSYLWGFLADSYGRKWILRPTLVAAFLTTLLSSFVSNFWLLIVLRFLNGFFLSAACSIPLAYLGEFHSNRFRSKAIIGASVMYGLSSLIVPFIAWLLIKEKWEFYIPLLQVTYKPWRLFVLVCGLPELLSFFGISLIPESPKFTLVHMKHAETVETLRKMFTVNTGKPANDYPFTNITQDEQLSTTTLKTTKENVAPTLLDSIRQQITPLFQSEFLLQTTLLCSIRFFIFILTSGMNVWFPKILDEIGEYNRDYPNNRTTICEIFKANTGNLVTNSSEMETQCKNSLHISTYYYTALLEIGYLLGFAILGFIINRMEKVTVLSGTLFITGGCGIAVALVKEPILATYLFLMLMLCGLGSIILNTMIVDIYPTKLRAMAVSLTYVTGNLGGIFGTNVIGTLLETNCISAFIFSALCIVFSAFLGFLIKVPKV